MWRMQKDSNLRNGDKPFNCLAGSPNRPLWHASVEERQGFEPWIRLATYTAVPRRLLQPLGHLSMLSSLRSWLIANPQPVPREGGRYRWSGCSR